MITDSIGPANAKDDFILRRARLKSKGYLFTKKLTYAYQQDLLRNEATIMDLFLEYKLPHNFSLQFGRNKLPSHLGFVTSSQKTSFPEREIFHAVFTPDRAEGFQVKHKFEIGKTLITERFSITDEQWIQKLGEANKLDLGGRLEIFPLGKFTNNEYNVDADLEREPNPKIMIATAYDYNSQAGFSGGRIGNPILPTGDLATFFIDIVIKYKGISAMGQFADRTLAKGINSGYFTGKGFMGKISYLNTHNYEFSTRFSNITATNTNQYSAGLNKYIVGNNLKVQYGFDYNDDTTLNNKDFTQHTLQLEIAF